MKPLAGGLETVPGFLFSAVECGIKYENRLDLALIHSKAPCSAAGAFTTNVIQAAPVKLCRERISNPVHAILINANNANACTGEEGYRNAASLSGEVAGLLGVPAGSVLAASTGVIGVQLPTEKIRKSLPALVRGLSGEKGPLVARAIMTTDTRPKEAAARFETSRGEFTVAGAAKGAGMIAPNMATLLCFLLTDMPLGREVLDGVFRKTVAATLNAVTIDGDMSTNDTAIILCPAAGGLPDAAGDAARFEEALLHVLSSLSEMLVRDGEGATKFVTVSVTGARSDGEARLAARAVAQSLLVKTALFGNDPNWGRIACAAGYSGAGFREETLSISIGPVPLLLRGVPQAYDRKLLGDAMGGRDISVAVDLGVGGGRFTFLTTDVSYDYVRINAEYTT
jgi:glutamate N-acetyltransferase/amino-acid N-acetyltransferase